MRPRHFWVLLLYSSVKWPQALGWPVCHCGGRLLARRPLVVSIKVLNAIDCVWWLLVSFRNSSGEKWKLVVLSSVFIHSFDWLHAWLLEWLTGWLTEGLTYWQIATEKEEQKTNSWLPTFWKQQPKNNNPKRSSSSSFISNSDHQPVWHTCLQCPV